MGCNNTKETVTPDAKELEKSNDNEEVGKLISNFIVF